ncbi:MAG: proliferating cell nuclear antigen (pcna) [Desulfurococcales archaeon]|nr:proliferating cell nuclear antigen (pcna) [Desulfurococcales archaeon]
MLRLVFSDARTWRYMVASIEKILDEAVFIANEEGLSLRALDTSHVVMVDLFYPNSAFDEYDIGDSEVTFGVSFDALSKVLRRSRKEDRLELGIDGSHITIRFLGRGVRTFKIPQIQLTHERLPEPKIQFTVTAKMMSTVFREAIRDLEAMADIVTLKADDEYQRLLLTGTSDIGSVEIELSLERQSLLDLEVESPDTASYTLEYYTYMLQAAQAADLTTIRYSMDAPVRVDLEYQAGGRLTFYVSPRME